MAIIDRSPQESMYYDRYDGPMLRWLESEGLPADVDDQTITERLESYLQLHKGISAPWMDGVSVTATPER